MNKNLIKIFIILLILCICMLVYIFYFPKILMNNSDFRTIYKRKDDIKVYIRVDTGKRVEITDRKDIYNILDTLKNEKIKNVAIGDTIIGGDYYVLFFEVDDKIINMSFCSNQVGVLDKQYYIEKNIKDKLKNITEKYVIKSN